MILSMGEFPPKALSTTESKSASPVPGLVIRRKLPATLAVESTMCTASSGS